MSWTTRARLQALETTGDSSVSRICLLIPMARTFHPYEDSVFDFSQSYQEARSTSTEADGTSDEVSIFNSPINEPSTPYTETDNDLQPHDPVIDPALLNYDDIMSKKRQHDLLSPEPMGKPSSAQADNHRHYREPSYTVPDIPASKKRRPDHLQSLSSSSHHKPPPSSKRVHNDAPSSRTHATTSRSHAPTSHTHAPSSRTNAPTSRTHAPSSRTNAPSAPNNALTSRTNAPSYRTNAPSVPSSYTNASSSCTNAPSSRTNAPSAPNNAPSSRTNAPSAHTHAPPKPRPRPVAPRNPVQPLSFTKKIPHDQTSLSRVSLPPADDDSDDEAIGSNTLLYHNKVMSSKERASVHSQAKLDIARQHTAVETLQTEIHKIRKEQSKLAQDQSGRTANLEAKIDDIIKRLEALEVQDRPPTSTRDNALNSAIRCVLLRMMGIEHNEDLPQPLDGPGEYWTTIDVAEGGEEESGTKALRPKFEASWTANSKWHHAFLTRFRRDASTYEIRLSQATVEALNDKELKSLAGKVFKNMKEQFKEQNRPPGIQSLNVQIIRREKRQSEKAALATAVRIQFPDLQGSDCDFLFATKWQSTDYSASDVSVDESEAEAHSNLATRHKAYKKTKKNPILSTHPPNWRSKRLRDIIADIRNAVDDEISEKDKKKKAWMKKRAPRVQGSPRLTRHLPLHSVLKTPRWAILTQWLASLTPGDREYQQDLITDNDELDTYSPAASSEADTDTYYNS